MKFILTEDVEDLETKAKEEFGITPYFSEAGYLLQDGSMIDFSERRDGGQPYRRSLDHRNISRVYDKELSTQTAYLIDFMNRGNIRLMYPVGIDISIKPTEKQYTVLKRFISDCIRKYGEFNLDISDLNGDNIESYFYEGIKAIPDRVIEDIRNYFNSL